jgi:predicted AAA+ superfamily ATPase
MKLITQSFASINEEIYFRENYISLLEQFSNTKNITIITGQRRVGKSFIVL